MSKGTERPIILANIHVCMEKAIYSKHVYMFLERNTLLFCGILFIVYLLSLWHCQFKYILRKKSRVDSRVGSLLQGMHVIRGILFIGSKNRREGGMPTSPHFYLWHVHLALASLPPNPQFDVPSTNPDIC